MIRRSGVRPAVWASKIARGTPRRAASGHSPSRQERKFAACARIAWAVIRGCPDDPDSPLHSGREFGAAGGGTAPVDPPNSENGKRLSLACPKAEPAKPAVTRAAINNTLGLEILIIFSSFAIAAVYLFLVLLWGTYMI